ncbi:MAG TPA: HU family DNA-binding protein [Alphaproteobacteria bacterium]|nr:HU family DNA-binding protein [Alphaproteobacteria bacterium]
MNTAELASKIAEGNDLTVMKSKRLITAIVAAINEATQKGDSVTLVGLGTFKIKEQPAGKRMVFVQAKTLKDALNPGT